MLASVSLETGGDPMGQGKWLNCRLADIAEKLKEQGHQVSQPVISRLLKKHDYRLRANVKRQAGKQHPDRDKQFKHIQQQRAEHQQAGQPTLSIDTKKKELVGNFKNKGQIWCQQPEQVSLYDFPNDALGRAVPYGIYDLQHNCGTVFVGQSADTPTFAVDNIVRWCQTELPERYLGTNRLMLEADGGGSNSCRSRVWKQQLQEKVADPFNLVITVCHYPTGASKWNPIEHRLFSEISKTWAGCPLRTFEAVIDYIAQTTTISGLSVRAHRVTEQYCRGVKVSDEIMDTLNLQKHDVCPQWNYTIFPRPLPSFS